MSPQTPMPGAPQHAPQGNRFFDWMRSLRFTRQDGWLGGVCAAVAYRLNIDPVIVRGVVVVAAVLGAPVLVLYAAAWVLLPDRGGVIHAEQLGRGRVEPPVVGAALMALVGLLPSAHPALPFLGSVLPWWGVEVPWWGLDGDFGDVLRVLWTLAVVGSAVWLVVWLVRRSAAGASGAAAAGPSAATAPGTVTDDAAAPTAPPLGDEPTMPLPAEDLASWKQQQERFKQQRDEFARADEQAQRAARQAERRRFHEEQAAARRDEYQRTRPDPLFTLTAIGVALLTGALVVLGAGGGGLERDAVIAGLAAALAVLALAIIVNGLTGKRSGGSSGLAVILAIALLVSSVAPFGARVVAVGQPHFAPKYTDGGSQQLIVGAGQTQVDLTGYWDDAPDGPAVERGFVRLVLGAGQATVLLPAGEYVSYTLAGGVTDVRLTDEEGRVGPLYFGSGHELLPAGMDDATDAGRRLHLELVVGAGELTLASEGDLR